MQRKRQWSKLTKKAFGLLDCCKVCQIGQYHALYKVLGAAKFDKLFSHAGGSPMCLSDYNALKTPQNPLLPFLELLYPETGSPGSRDLAVGQRICLKNVSAYHNKHPLMGEARGL